MQPRAAQGMGHQKSPFVTYTYEEGTKVLNDVEKKQNELNQIRRQMDLVKASAAEHHTLGEEAGMRADAAGIRADAAGKRATEHRQKAHEAQRQMDASAARMTALKEEQQKITKEADETLIKGVAMLALGTTNENFIKTRAPKEGIEFDLSTDEAFIRKNAMLRIIQLSKQFHKNLSPGDFRRCKAPGSLEGLTEFIAAIPEMNIKTINIPCPMKEKHIVALAKACLAKPFVFFLGDPETDRKFKVALGVK